MCLKSVWCCTIVWVPEQSAFLLQRPTSQWSPLICTPPSQIFPTPLCVCRCLCVTFSAYTHMLVFRTVCFYDSFFQVLYLCIMRHCSVLPSACSETIRVHVSRCLHIPVLCVFVWSSNCVYLCVRVSYFLFFSCWAVTVGRRIFLVHARTHTHTHTHTHRVTHGSAWRM